MIEELLPCPFCGADATVEQDEDRGNRWGVYCENLGCEAQITDFHLREDAVRAWNQRVTGDLEEG